MKKITQQKIKLVYLMATLKQHIESAELRFADASNMQLHILLCTSIERLLDSSDCVIEVGRDNSIADNPPY
jgi:hypothetical protein